MRRRSLLALPALAVPSALALAACSSAEGESAASDAGGSADTAAQGAFAYTPPGYEGLTIELPAVPQRIVADIYSAAALQPYGFELAGVFGYGKDGGGQGDLDLEAENVLGLDGELSLEKLAAAQPDVIIGVGNADGTGWTWWDEKVQEQATALATFVPVKMGATPPEMIETYRELARALGADVESEEQTALAEAYEAARERLRAVTAEKPDLTVLPINSDADAVYSSSTLGVVKALIEDGVSIVGPETPADSAWATSSWETIGDYPADVVLQYEGSVGYEENPLWLALPAVAAGQVGGWDDKRAYTYSLQTAWLTEIADLLERSEDIVP